MTIHEVCSNQHSLLTKSNTTARHSDDQREEESRSAFLNLSFSAFFAPSAVKAVFFECFVCESDNALYQKALARLLQCLVATEIDPK